MVQRVGELEAAASIVTTCLPTLGPLLTKSHALARSIQSSFTKLPLRSRASSKERSDTSSGEDSVKTATSEIISRNVKVGLSVGTYNSVQSKYNSRSISDDVSVIYIERSFSSASHSDQHEVV
jgi:hypothetical protein